MVRAWEESDQGWERFAGCDTLSVAICHHPECRDGRHPQPKMVYSILSMANGDDERKSIVFKGKSALFWPHLPPEIIR